MFRRKAPRRERRKSQFNSPCAKNSDLKHWVLIIICQCDILHRQMCKKRSKYFRVCEYFCAVMPEKTSKKRVRILIHLPRHKGLEHMRPMLVKFPLSRSFGIRKATALLHPVITSEQKFSGALGLRVQKEQIFCKKRQKRS